MSQVKNRTDKKTTVRMRVIFAFFLAAAAIVIGRLAYFQLGMYDYYQTKVLNQVTIQQEVNPERGNILDRNGNILATNKTVFNVILSPADIIRTLEKDAHANSDDDPENNVVYEFTDEEYGISCRESRVDEFIAHVLSAYLDVDRQKIIEKSAKVEDMYEVVKNNVEADLAERIEVFIDQFDLSREIYFVASSKRYYPKGSCFCQA